MNSPAISVLIPCYNAENYLCQCLDTILCQWQPDMEIICINDGSEDRTLALLQEYRGKYPAIQVVDIPHGGVANARNVGLDSVRGEYIAWIDPDDYVSADWYSTISRVIKTHSPDVIVMDICKFDDSEKYPHKYGRTGGFVPRETFLEDVIRDLRIWSGFPDKVIRSRYFRGKRFDASLAVLEDYALLPTVLCDVNTVYYIPQVLYYYRQHPQSLLHQVTPECAWRSVELSLARLEAVKPKYRSAAITAVARQMDAFCFHYHSNVTFAPYRQEYGACCKFLRKHRRIIRQDRELSLKYRCKLLSLGFGLYRPLRNIKNLLCKGEWKDA